MADQRSVESAARSLERRAREGGLCLDGFVIDVRGQDPIERSFMPDVRRDVFSVSKSVTSIAIGIAASEGRLGLDDAVLDHLSEFRSTAAAGVERVTIRHLLTMTSGIVYRWVDDDFDHPGDPAADILATPLGFEPGEGHAYRGAGPYLLSRIVHATTGQDLRDYLVPRLFTPLGIRNPQWQRCPIGFSIGAVGLELRTGELARMTRTLRDGGVHEGRPVIPADYVAAMQRDGRAPDHRADGEPFIMRASGYGFGVWRWPDADAWFMSGLHGQTGMIVPSRDLCITTTAQYGGHSDDIHDAIWSTIEEHL